MPPPSHTPVAEQAKKAATVSLPSELLDLVDSISRTLKDVETHQLPQLAGCKGPVTLHEQLAADVRAEIGRVRRDLEVSLSLSLYQCRAPPARRRQS